MVDLGVDPDLPLLDQRSGAVSFSQATVGVRRTHTRNWPWATGLQIAARPRLVPCVSWRLIDRQDASRGSGNVPETRRGSFSCGIQASPSEWGTVIGGNYVFSIPA